MPETSMTETATATTGGAERARTLRHLVAEEAADSERNRTLNSRTVDALWESGLMSWCNPVEAGGSEPTFPEMIATWIELAWQDGSLGWIGIANLPSAAACAAYLPDDGFEEVFTAHDNRVTVGGQFFPNGLGETVDGGYRITGAWNFGSGTGHSEYVAGRVHPHRGRRDGDRRRRDPPAAGGGHPPPGDRVHRRLERPRSEGHRLLRLQRDRPVRPRIAGHSSCSSAPPAGFVGRRSTWGSSRSPRPGTPRGPSGWPRARIDDVTELAATKVRMGDDASIANRASFQRNLSHHRALWKAARLLVVTTFADVEQVVADGGALTPAMRAELRVAATFATESSREIVRVGPPGRRNLGHPGGEPARAGLPGHVHRDPARLHRREDLHRRGQDPPRHRRGPVRVLTGDPPYICSDLDLEELLQAERAELAPVARLLVAPERGHGVEPATVDLDLAGPQPAGHRLGPFRVGGPDAAGQSVLGVVGDVDRLVLGVVGDDGQHRAEDLVPGDGHVAGHRGEHRRLHEEAGVETVGRLGPTGQQPGPLPDPLVDVGADPVPLDGRHQRAEPWSRRRRDRPG